MDFIYIKILLLLIKRESSFIGIWEHNLTGEVFEIFEKRERKPKGGYETTIWWRYLQSETKSGCKPFMVKIEHLNRSVNFNLIEKIPELPC